ncbi:MAG: hypothetical protein WD035_09580, partial [Balneolaceae bacterium]
MKGRSHLFKKNKREGVAVLIMGMMFVLAGLIIPLGGILEYGIGYILGLLPMVLHFLHLRMIRNLGHKKFMFSFYAGTLIKLLLVLAVYTLLITLTNFEQISFTLSFIISYIFHSV